MTTFEEMLNSYFKDQEREPYGKQIKPGIYEYNIVKIYVEDRNIFSVYVDVHSVNSRINKHQKIGYVSMSEYPIFKGDNERKIKSKMSSIVYKIVQLCNLFNVDISDINTVNLKEAISLVVDRLAEAIKEKPVFIAIDKRKYKGKDGKDRYNFYVAEGRNPIALRYDQVSAIFKWNESAEEEKEREERTKWLREENREDDSKGEDYGDMPWLS